MAVVGACVYVSGERRRELPVLIKLDLKLWFVLSQNDLNIYI